MFTQKLIRKFVGIVAVVFAFGLLTSCLAISQDAGAKKKVEDTEKTPEITRVSSNLITLDLKNFEKIEKDGFVVYHLEGMEKLVSEIMEFLEKIRVTVKEKLGRSLPTLFERYGIILHRNESPNISVLETGGEVVVPICVRQDNTIEPESMWATVHEYTEFAATELTMYMSNPYTRWIGDGLAEYVSYSMTGNLGPYGSNPRLDRLIGRLKELLIDDIDTYDLTKWRCLTSSPTKTVIRDSNQDIDFNDLPPEVRAKVEKVIKAIKKGDKIPGGFKVTVIRDEAIRDKLGVHGYAVSFAFWLKLVENHGEGILKEFLNQAKEMDKPSNDNLVPILEKITGEKDLKSTLANVDVKEMFEFLKAKRTQLREQK